MPLRAARLLPLPSKPSEPALSPCPTNHQCTGPRAQLPCPPPTASPLKGRNSPCPKLAMPPLQRLVLYSFPAICWAYGAGALFSSFVSIVFWTG